jgi:NAD(P)-dependent dehydrogenase (short-subunit alcohol dehydrogenase family)
MSSAALDVLAGRVAIVTGGAANLGRAIVERLARRGASVVIGDRNAGMRVTGGRATY